MKKLFLSSIGLAPETNDYFFALVGKKPVDILIGFIPTASDVEVRKDYVQMDLEDIEKLGMRSTIVDLKKEKEQSLYEKLSKVDVIMVEGGNTFCLLDWVRKSGFDKALNKLLDGGKIYYGISAGSYIACPTIEAANWKHVDKNIFNLTDLTGLNLVPFIISAHYNKEKYKQAVVDGVKTTKLPVVTLNDKQAIVIEGNKYKIIGDNERNFFNGFKEKY